MSHVIENPNHLTMVAVHFSTRCGASCTFCYAGEQVFEKEKPTDISQIIKILKKLAVSGVKEILFVGGDPVIHPDFIKSLEVAKDLGFITIVLSNSWEIRPVDKFKHAISLIDYCETTMLGSTETKHDSITNQKGSLKRLIPKLRNINALGKKVGICVNVMPDNLNDIYNIVHRLIVREELSLRSLMIQRIIPSGNSTGEFKFGLNLNDVGILMNQIDKIHNEFNLKIEFEDPVPWCTVEEKYHKYLARCEWGYTKGSVNSNGFLNRCGADDHYRLGSIFETDVQEKWNNHPVLRSFRSKEYLAEECQSCNLLEKCGGGCPLSCGTLNDHSIDYLYNQKIEQATNGNFNTDLSVLNSDPKLHARFAFKGDLKNIVDLEEKYFKSFNEIIFTQEKIETYFAHSPKAFRVTLRNNCLSGYQITFPLNSKGVLSCFSKDVESITDIGLEGIESRFSVNTKGLFLEVIAGDDFGSRIALLRNLKYLLSSYPGIPIFAFPITESGKSLIRKSGFSEVVSGNNLMMLN